MFEAILVELDKIILSSPFLGLFISFFAGVLTSFSPCIYPLIPITLGVVGAASSETRARGFVLSLVFALGVSTVYVALGILSSLIGVFFGKLFVNPISYFLITIVFVVFGLHLLGVIKINFFQLSFSHNHSLKKGLIPTFILGMVGALAISPCNFPVLGTILSLIALRKDVLYGAVALLFFSLGYGVIIVVLGTFSTLIRKLPKQGLWLIIINKVMGGVLILIGLYFLGKFLSLVL